MTIIGTELPSGTYIVQMNGERFTDTLSVALLK